MEAKILLLRSLGFSVSHAPPSLPDSSPTGSQQSGMCKPLRVGESSVMSQYKKPMGWGEGSNPPREKPPEKDGGVGREGIPGRGTSPCSLRRERSTGFLEECPGQAGVGSLAGCRSKVRRQREDWTVRLLNG